MRLFLMLVAISPLLLLAPLAGAQTAADAVYDRGEMEAARRALNEGVGNTTTNLIIADRFEFRTNEGANLLLWDVQGWHGTDAHKLWIKTEGEYRFAGNSFEEFEIQVLYSRAVSPYFDLQFGLRHDIEPSPSRTHGVIGVHGLAPYWFEIDAAAFISSKGEVTGRIEAEHELVVTQRLILQPRGELSFSFQSVEELGLGSGLSSAEGGLRLRYEVKREFAPYIGVSWVRTLGSTADFAREHEEQVGSVSFVAGLRMWF